MKLFKNVMVATTLLASVASVAQGQIDVTGNTKACFGNSCSVATNSTGGFGVSYHGESFNWNDVTSTPQTVTLGSIKFNDFSCVGGLCGSDSFKLSTTFTAPPTTPDHGTYTADIFGAFFAGAGGAGIDFSNATQSFAYTGGTLFLKVNDFGVVDWDAAGTYNITGSVYTTTTPEPGSMALLGTGLVGLVPVVRRRRK